MKLALLDTGPLIAYLDVNDPEHSVTSGILDRYRGILCTTGAVVTEAMYFVSKTSHGPSTLAAFLEKSQARICDCFGCAELKEAVALMERYHDLPMDFADATLVLLAHRLDCRDIFTLDRRGFKSFRTTGGKGFRLLLDG